MKTTRKGLILYLFLLLVITSACAIGGTNTTGPTQTPYIITATFPPPAEGDADTAATLTAEAASAAAEPEAHTLPANLRLVYTDASGNLYKWTEAGGVSPILSTGDIMGPLLSDDGQLIAYVRQSDFSHYSLWVIGFDGTGARELVTSDQFYALRNKTDAIGAEPYIYNWAPNTHTIAFNTSPIFEGPGLFINDDLHLVNADTGVLNTLLGPGDGGMFYYSPDGLQIALVTPDTISLINNDGSNRRSNVLMYDTIMTYSEYLFYPAPKWSTDSTFLRVAIPPSDILGEPLEQTTLWHIPTDGSAAGIAGHVSSLALTEVSISPDMSWVAYINYFTDGTDRRRNLHINNFSGTADHTFATAELDFKTWAPDSRHFVYNNIEAGITLYADKDGGERQLIPVGAATSLSFANEYTYIYLRKMPANWEIVYGNIDGTQTVIDTLPIPGEPKFPNYSFVY